MGMHTEEWIKNEEKNKESLISLNRDDYKLDFIKVKFGDEYIPVPQNSKITAVITDFGNKSLEGALTIGVFSEVAKKANIEKEGNTFHIKKEDWDNIEKAMEEIIYEKSPQYVLEKTFERNYQWEMEYFLKDEDEPFTGAVTDEEFSKMIENFEKEDEM